MLNLTAFPSREALIEAATERLANALRDAVTERGEACAALSGGSTPEPIYRALAQLPLYWPSIRFVLVDERFVPVESVASNRGMIERVLLPALEAGACFDPMYLPTQSLELAADDAEFLNAPLKYDIALMGMGADGHTASWFPNARGLDVALDPNTTRSAVAITAPHAPHSAERLTLTRTALRRSRELLLVITGDEKRARLERAVASGDAPVAALFETGMPPIEVLWAA